MLNDGLFLFQNQFVVFVDFGFHFLVSSFVDVGDENLVLLLLGCHFPFDFLLKEFALFNDGSVLSLVICDDFLHFADAFLVLVLHFLYLCDIFDFDRLKYIFVDLLLSFDFLLELPLLRLYLIEQLRVVPC